MNINQHAYNWIDESGLERLSFASLSPIAQVEWAVIGLTLLVIVAAVVILVLRNKINRRTLNLELANRAILESQFRFEQVSNLASDYMFYSIKGADGKYTTTWVAGAFETITGYTMEEYNAIGGWHSLLHPDDVARDEQSIQQLERNQKVVNEVRNFTKSGEMIYVRSMGQPVFDKATNQLVGVIGAVQDITLQKRAEIELQNKNRALITLSAANQALVRANDEKQLLKEICEICVDLGGYRMVWVGYIDDNEQKSVTPVANAGFEEGYLEIAAITWADIERGQGPAGTSIREGRTVVAQDIPNNPRFASKVAARERGFNSCISLPLNIEGKTFGAIIFYSGEIVAFDADEVDLLEKLADDLSYGIYALRTRVEHIRAEKAFRELNMELEQRVFERTADLQLVNLELERAARTKDEFLASMSHELRTPLTGILGLSESLQLDVYGTLSDKQKQILKMVEDSGRHLLDLINDILDVAKIEAGKLELHTETCSLNMTGQATMQMVRGMAQKKNLKSDFSIEPEEIIIMGDSRRLKQMLVNLLSNAVKFTPDGGKFGLSIVGWPAENKVYITVWDTGIGINKQDLEKLFQPFMQLDSSLSRQYTGTGLGLSLVKRMALLHGGNVEVASEPGVGSRFTIVLPWNPEISSVTSTSL